MTSENSPWEMKGICTNCYKYILCVIITIVDEIFFMETYSFNQFY